MERSNFYYCPGCDKILIRSARTKTYLSYCETAGRKVSAKLLKQNEYELFYELRKYQPK